MSSSRTTKTNLLVSIAHSSSQSSGASAHMKAVWDCRTWALDVTDDASGLVVHELNANLGDTTTGACYVVSAILFFPHKIGKQPRAARVDHVEY